MAHADASEEWLRLTRLYQEMCETELLRLREDFHDLTPIAQDVLRPILETRGLWNSVPIVEDSSAQSRHADYSFLRTSADLLGPEPVDRDSTLMDTGVAVLACDSLEDAGLLRTVLEEKSIPSVVITTKRGYPVRFPEILVFQEDVARATELLDGADLQSLRLAAENESGPMIEGSTACPGCGSTEILLQPPQPNSLNTWLCAECGRSWQDNLPPNWPSGS